MESGQVLVITGASGLLGRAIFRKCKESGFWTDVIGTCLSRSGQELTQLDLTDFQATRAFLEQLKPRYLIHSAAHRTPDKVEKDYEAARKLNVEATRNLAEAMNDVGGLMLYVSTDYVFDGVNPPYSHNGKTNPLNSYGVLKRDGEIATLTANPNNLVFRIPVLYGDVEYLEESAITVLFKALKDAQGLPSPSQGKCIMSDYEIRRPSHVDDIASIANSLLKLHSEDPGKVEGGPYQWCGYEAMTKYNMVECMGSTFGMDTSMVVAEKEPPSSGAQRPHDTTMSRDRIEAALGPCEHFHTEFKNGIRKCLEKWL